MESKTGESHQVGGSSSRRLALGAPLFAPAVRGWQDSWRRRAKSQLQLDMPDNLEAQIAALKSMVPPWQGKTRVEDDGEYKLATRVSVYLGDEQDGNLPFILLENPGHFVSVRVGLTLEHARLVHDQLGAVLDQREEQPR